MKLVFVTTLIVAATFANAFPQGVLPIPRPGEGGYDKDNYFQYINVPKEKVFEWGYRRGDDPNHFREEYLSQNHHSFKAKVKWGDKYGGYGEHFYDYNHGPKYGDDHSSGYHETSYKDVPTYSPPQPVYKPSSYSATS
ncbi:uncharacterized protein [Lepeophtheirus salmonis]|nr:uncharacterized protein LOC121124439 [Lepeophtheirus salmonis]